jgi:hypothetical protein
MQLLEIIDYKYGPDASGGDKESGGNSEHIGEFFR